MFKLNLLTIFLCLVACEETEKITPQTTRSSVEKKAVVEPSSLPAVEKKAPEGHIPLPEELRIETEISLDLDEASAQKLVETLEQEIKEP